MSTPSEKYDAGPGHPLPGCGDGAVAMTAAEHCLAGERALASKRLNAGAPAVLEALDGEAGLHCLAAIATALVFGGGSGG
jgi:hypothetical protein